MTSATPTFSIVIPVFNEEESLDALVRSLDEAYASLKGDYELVFIDDGSRDRTLETLKRLAANRSDVRVFSFRRNFGKSPALTCGFQQARGRYVHTMDADLQDDPGNLQRMHDHMTRTGADMVSGWRKDRRDSLLKVVSSQIFNLFIVRLLFGASFKDMNSGSKLYTSDAAKDLRLYGGMHRFIPIIAQEMGYRVDEIPVPHHPRRFGSSKYRSTKILTELPDLLTLFFLMKYTRRPLHFFGRIGSALFLLGFSCLAYLTYLWTQSIPIGTRPLLSFGVLLVLVGGQTVFTGLLADLIVNMNQSRSQDFPLKFSSDRQDTPVLAASGQSS